MDFFAEFIATFFSYTAQLSFERARELLEKERELNRSNSMKQFSVILGNFIVAEKSYFELGFLSAKNKIFLRKDNSLRSVYESLRTDLHRLEEGNASESVIGVISNQLCQYLTARVQLVELYERMYSVSTSNKHIKFDELSAQVAAIADAHAYSFSDVLLSPIKASWSFECEVLKQLLAAQQELQNWLFVPALSHLNTAHTHLAAWEKTFHSRESWKLAFGASFLKGNSQPALFQWLTKFKIITVNKYSLYFYRVLAQQTSLGELRTICSKHNIDYFHKFQSLQKRIDATSVMLVFDPRGLKNWNGPGYKFPSEETEPRNGLIVIVHYPSLNDRLATIEKILSEKSSELSCIDKVVTCYSSKEGYTFFMMSIDPRITLVAIFDSKREDRETVICNYMADFSILLRFNRLFANLKISKM
ncbi:KICSTOR subunit 2 isoform X2 [Bemisia tabaci]|uniref:KICSTOR subunit 2 isoform X2 n=1 Tax=Bemisia tabaci TaxID=7038 RepID=UPI003B28BBEB